MQLWDKTKYKLAVPEWCLPGDGIFSLQMASSLGLDGVQLEAGFYETGFKLGHPWVQRLYREAAAQYGLELISIVMNDLDRHGLRHGRGTEFGDIAYEGLDIALEAAAAMEIPVLMIPSFLNNDMRTEQDVEHTIEALQYACDQAAPNGITIATETAIDAKALEQLFDRVDRKNLRLFYDSEITAASGAIRPWNSCRRCIRICSTSFMSRMAVAMWAAANVWAKGIHNLKSRLPFCGSKIIGMVCV